MIEPKMTLEYLTISGQVMPNCADPGCELDASVYVTENDRKQAWCTGHAHVMVAMWMVGL